MNLKLEYVYAFLATIIIQICLILLVTICHYFDWFGNGFINTLKTIIPFLAILSSSIYLGKNCTSKGWLKGIVFGTVYILFICIFNYLAVGNGITFYHMINFIIILVLTTIGSMIGINTNPKEA